MAHNVSCARCGFLRRVIPRVELVNPLPESAQLPNQQKGERTVIALAHLQSRNHYICYNSLAMRNVHTYFRCHCPFCFNPFHAHTTVCIYMFSRHYYLTHPRPHIIYTLEHSSLNNVHQRTIRRGTTLTKKVCHDCPFVRHAHCHNET